jgi:hypothetical protein
MTTYTLTTQQLDDFRADMDLPSDGVFTDTELQRLYNRAEGNYEYAVALAWRQLRANATKYADYKAGQSGESLSQIYAHISAQMDYWLAEAGFGGVALEGGLISLNTDATRDNQSQWDGTEESLDYGDYGG